MNKVVALLDRAVLAVTGPDAEVFLQNLITNDMDKLAESEAILAALLTPQGKINYEFFVAPIENGYVLDTAKDRVKDLFKKLTLYKMRADVDIKQLYDSHMVVWFEGDGVPATGAQAVFVDPRSADMGRRAIVGLDQIAEASQGFETGSEDDYLAKRLFYGVPEGGYDYDLGDTFPHEAGYDVLEGVDFEKGCYVGQEVVSRMQHRANVRKRIVMVEGAETLPRSGTELSTDKSMIGILGSCLDNKGLGLVRLDRAAKALTKAHEIKADGVSVRLSIPPWASYDFPQEEA